jgi:hypothetical protein
MTPPYTLPPGARIALTILAPLAGTVLLQSGCRVPCNRLNDSECIYRYVMVVDKVNPDRSSDSHTVGADISAVSLFHNVLKEEIPASDIPLCEFGPGDNVDAQNCEYALGDSSDLCRTDDATAIDYVSLGGVGGHLIAVFDGEVIDDKDIVRVYECARREFGDRKYDYYDIFVGTNDDPTDPSWVLCEEWATYVTDCSPDFKTYIGDVPGY